MSRPRRTTLSNVLVAVGGLCLAIGLGGYARASFAQAELRDRWDERALERPTLPADLPPAAASSRNDDDPREGEPVARLRIPRIGVDAVVLEGIGSETLALAPGHYPGTAFPGEGGHVVLSAHRDSFFKDLGRLEAGDPIVLARREGGDVEYQVTRSYIVHRSNRTVIVPLETETLTLITCYPFVYAGAAPYRYIVEAHPAPADPAGG